QLRQVLRERSFEKWSGLIYQGRGAKQFKTFPESNAFTHGESSLTSTEWTDALKLSVNYAALAGVPGVEAQGSDRCRRGCNERETIAHAQGSCTYGLNRRNERHHWVKHKISSLLQERGYQCYDEVPCRDVNGTNRR